MLGSLLIAWSIKDLVSILNSRNKGCGLDQAPGLAIGYLRESIILFLPYCMPAPPCPDASKQYVQVPA